MKRLALLLVFVAGFKTYVAADQPAAAISCTALVSQSDCTKATASFELERDNKIFDDVEILIADERSFRDESSRAALKRTQDFLKQKTGLIGPTAIAPGEEQDTVLFFFEKGPVPHITRVVVSLAAFYKLSLDAKGNLTKETHFDSASAYILASKINGYVTGWFMGVMATIQ